MLRRLVCVVTLLVTSTANVQRLIDFEPAADRLKEATRTVTVTRDGTNHPNGTQTVTVCSGVLVLPGLVVTSIDATPSDKIWISDATGSRVTARLSVVDHFSGLTLLEADELAGDGLQIAAESPKSGKWVISAAAWGREEPILTHGIIASTQRTRGVTPSPPLLQCDLRTVDTSSGAAIVADDGKLLGVIVATNDDGQLPGTFAIPARHVQRLIRARVPQKLRVLKNQRPSVGLVLSMGEQPNQVVVERVVKDGPADRVGIRSGDEVMSVDGLKIRWVYEALQPVLQRQPGDALPIVVRRDGQERQFDLVLGGGITLPPEAQIAGDLQARRLQVSRVGEREFSVRDHRGSVRNLRFNQEAVEQTSQPMSPLQILEKAVDRYGRAIVALQSEIKKRDQERIETLNKIDEMQEVIEALRQQLQQQTDEN